ncbi:MAG TPA: hypothetical protein VGO40_21630, partial [Longimicrobium sp.]|nr:hypothetical protein [Longimicrobium sp.]
GGHMMVAAGVDTDTGFVLVDDPWPPNTGDSLWISYPDYVSQTGVHTHWVDYYDIAPAGGPPPSSKIMGTEPMSDEPSAAAPTRHADADAAAHEGLRLLPRLAEPAARVVGAGPPPDASALDLGEPFTVKYVQRDTLATYQSGADPRRLLDDVGERLYPVLGSGGQTTAAVRVTQRDGEWTVKSVGEPHLARDVVEVRNRDAAVTGTALGDYLLVQIPALYQAFVGREDTNGRLVLLPVYDDFEKGMARAEPGTGDYLLSRLVPDAEQGRSALAEEGPEGLLL